MGDDQRGEADGITGRAEGRAEFRLHRIVKASPRQRRRQLTVGCLILAVVLVAGTVAWRLANTPGRHFERALRALQTNDVRCVTMELRTLRKIDGYEPHASFLSGALLVRSGRYADAIAPLELAAQSESLRTIAGTLEGEAFYRMGRFLDAEGVLGAVLDRAPDAIDARRWLAAAFYDLGAAGHALEQLQILSRQVPNDARPDRLMGKIFKDHEDFVRAQEHYREALRRDPNPGDKSQLLGELGTTLLKQNKFDEALDVFAQCPESADILVGRYKCLTALGDRQAGQVLLNRAIELEPRNLDALLAATNESLASQAVPAEAQSLAQRAVEAHPFDAAAHYLMAQAYRRANQQDLADAEFNTMRKIQDLRQEFFRLREQSLKERANAVIRCRMAMISQQLGDESLARQWFEAALGADPSNEAARQALAEGRNRSD